MKWKKVQLILELYILKIFQKILLTNWHNKFNLILLIKIKPFNFTSNFKKNLNISKLKKFWNINKGIIKALNKHKIQLIVVLPWIIL
jgi:hypothetical protein